MPLPPFAKHFASMADMDQAQRAFYDAWIDAWRNGQVLGVDGQISYLFCFIYGILRQPPELVIQELGRLITAYPGEPEPFGFYCRRWSSDAHMILGKYRDALEAFPEPPLDGRSSTSTDTILSIRLLLSERLRGRDVITLNGPKTTRWGREHLTEVLEYIETAVRAEESSRGVNFLQDWAKTSHTYKYFVYSGSVHSRQIDLPEYSFSRNEVVSGFVRDMTREAENTAREEAGLPRVGEGWIAETILFYQLKARMPAHRVEHHARPRWLGRQHLDIFVPSLSVAVEFQGLQHDRPVEYFGGEAAFLECKRRDERKQSRCRENGIRLIYVRPGYHLDKLADEIIRGIAIGD